MGRSSSQKLLVPHLVNKFPAFWVTQMFTTALTSTRHLFLPSATLIQPMSLHPPSLINISKLHQGFLQPSSIQIQYYYSECTQKCIQRRYTCMCHWLLACFACLALSLICARPPAHFAWPGLAMRACLLGCLARPAYVPGLVCQGDLPGLRVWPGLARLVFSTFPPLPGLD